MQTTDLTIHKTLEVGVPVERAWEVFTSGVASWWPMTTHSIGQQRVVDVVLEPRAGGRFYEVLDDGTQSDWADVEAFDPPRYLRLNWRVNPQRQATAIEVRFHDLGGRTRVELTHSGWDGDAEGARSYDTGWDTVLSNFRPTS